MIHQEAFRELDVRIIVPISVVQGGEARKGCCHGVASYALAALMVGGAFFQLSLQNGSAGTVLGCKPLACVCFSAAMDLIAHCKHTVRNMNVVRRPSSHL